MFGLHCEVILRSLHLFSTWLIIMCYHRSLCLKLVQGHHCLRMLFLILSCINRAFEVEIRDAIQMSDADLEGINMLLMSPFSNFLTYTGMACGFQSYWQVRWILIGDPDYLERLCLSDGMRYLLALDELAFKAINEIHVGDVVLKWKWG
jgi:hypothetical protein